MAHETDSRQRTQGALAVVEASPGLYLSSASAGWEGVEAHAFVEPDAYEGWVSRILPVLSLVLFRGGGMWFEARQPNGPWSAVAVHDRDLFLRPSWETPLELRWKALSRVPTRTLNLRMSQELLTRTAEEMAGYDPARLSLVERIGFQDPLLTQIGLTLWRELEQPSPAGKLYAQAAAQLLAVHLVRHYTSAGTAIKEPTHGRLAPRQLQRVHDFVEAHLSQDLGLDALARQAGFSPYHFTRLFREATGETPHQFVLCRRIERARRLLENPDLPLGQVALATGFAHQSHLARHFKRYMGLTPSAYRRERTNRTQPQVHVVTGGRASGRDRQNGPDG